MTQKNDKEPGARMKAKEFREALITLRWNQVEAARRLAAASPTRVNAWVRGRRRVPPYIAAHVRTHLKLHELQEQIALGRVGTEG